MEQILEKIKTIRMVRGYTLEYMANELNISASTYRKVETNETKLTVVRLIEIAEILEVSLEDFFESIS